MMSGFVGVYQRDERNANELLLMQMLCAIAHRGADGAKHWVRGKIGFGQQLTCTTPEAWHECLPLQNDAQTLCLVFDGRIDNRAALTTALTQAGATRPAYTDGELILQAYESWGAACPAKIVGDFAFVIWDENAQQLFCARDIFGVKPFYYYCDDQRFICGSEIQQLLRDATISWQPNENLIGEFLADSLTSQTATLFRHIQRLPPAHSLTITAHKITLQRYWYPDQIPALGYRREAEYAEHFLTLFDQAMQSALRTTGTVGAHLSGGLDSSAVVCYAHKLLADGRLSAAGLETFSLVYPGRQCDEREYINAVIAQCSCIGHQLDGDQPALDYSGAIFWPTPPNITNLMRINELAQQRGIRVLLTGIGGDEWFEGSPYHYADLLQQGRLLALLKKIQTEPTPQTILQAQHPFWQFGVKPLLPKKLRRWRQAFSKAPADHSFLTPKLQAQIKRNDTPLNLSVTFKQRAQQHIYDFATNAWQTFRFELDNQLAALFGIETRHSLNDRRLVEFALALPENQRQRGAVTKFVLREALQNILPASIRARTDKADFAHLFPLFYRANAGDEVFTSLQTSRTGWVQGEKVAAMYQRMMEQFAAGDARYAEKTWELWAVFGLELWWRSVCLQNIQSFTTTVNICP